MQYDRLGGVAHLRGEYALARRHYQAALRIQRTSTQRQGLLAFVLQNLGCLALDEADPAAARPLLEESLRLRRTLEVRPFVMLSLATFAALGERAVPRIHFGVGTGELLGLMRNLFGDALLRTVLKDSAEIDNASARLMTVYELEHPVTSRETYQRCITYLNGVNAEIETQIRLTWPSHIGRLRAEGVL